MKYDFDDGGWIWTAAPASEFVGDDSAETLDAQAERIASWAKPKVDQLLSLKPGRSPA